MDLLLNHLSENGFLSEEQTNGSIKYSLEEGWELYVMYIFHSEKIIWVEIADWPDSVLYDLIKLSKTTENQVFFPWCDERLERILYHVELDLELEE